jgi:Restriction Enzyme Adenine Methylase Associated
MSDDFLSVRILDLIEAGLLSPSDKLHGNHGETYYEARLESDGTFICGSITSSSPSVAAGQAITARSGQKSPSRSYWSINGWKFWHVSDGDRAGKTLADVRREFLETRPKASTQH